MKLLNLLFGLLVFVAFGCTKSKPMSDLEFYGNTFIKMSDEVFEAPDDWIRVVLGAGEFEISIPPYMRNNSTDDVEESTNQTYIFNYCDTTGRSKYHYGRISVDFIRDQQFNLATEYIPYKDQYDFWKPIVQQALKGGKGPDGLWYPDGKLLNGPHCSVLYSNALIYIYDTCYRRGGHTKGKGPVSVHMSLLMNKKEAAVITVSYHDKDSVLFKDLFNVVKTFKWNQIYQ